MIGWSSCWYGTGIHQWDVPIRDFVAWKKVSSIENDHDHCLTDAAGQHLGALLHPTYLHLETVNPAAIHEALRSNSFGEDLLGNSHTHLVQSSLLRRNIGSRGYSMRSDRGALRRYQSGTDNWSHHKCHLGLRNLGPAARQDMAAPYVPKEETGGICRVLCGPLVNSQFSTFDRCALILRQWVYLKYISTGRHHQIPSRTRSHLSTNGSSFVDVRTPFAHNQSSSRIAEPPSG